MMKYFLVWKNIVDKKLILQHIIFITIVSIIYLFQGNIGHLLGFIRAIKNVKEVISKRKQEHEFAQVKDSEIFVLFND